MKKTKDNRRGSTLVEVIVTFALIVCFYWQQQLQFLLQ